MEVTTKDPYNWPMPQRHDLMSLQTLAYDRDLVRVKTAKVTTRQRGVSKNLETHDIDGAKPKQWARETNRQEYVGQNWDIAGSCPRALHFKLNKPEYNLNNSDIAMSKPMCQKFQTSRPPSNPLNPVYKLSHVEIKPPEPLKFIRDQISNDILQSYMHMIYTRNGNIMTCIYIYVCLCVSERKDQSYFGNLNVKDIPGSIFIINDDIEGAKPTIKKYFETRDVLAVRDIDGAKAKDPYVRRPETGYSSYNYDDVTRNQFKTTRSVNPLAPNYIVRDSDNKAVTIGEIQGSSPTKLPECIRIGDVVLIAT